MERKRFLIKKLQVSIIIKINTMLSCQQKFMCSSYIVHRPKHHIDVHGFRILIAQAQQHRNISAMPLAGFSQRAIQEYRHLLYSIQLSVHA